MDRGSIYSINSWGIHSQFTDFKDPDACIDGGDVIFTGKELLCGLSKRTNKKGMRALASAFPGLTVVPVTVTGPLVSEISLVGMITVGYKCTCHCTFSNCQNTDASLALFFPLRSILRFLGFPIPAEFQVERGD